MIEAESGACCCDCEECKNCVAYEATVRGLLGALGLDADHTAVDVLMRQPVGVGLAVAHVMERGDEPYEE